MRVLFTDRVSTKLKPVLLGEKELTLSISILHTDPAGITDGTFASIDRGSRLPLKLETMVLLDSGLQSYQVRNRYIMHLCCSYDGTVAIIDQTTIKGGRKGGMMDG